MQQPTWYLKRLRRMSGAEVAYRVARGVRTVSERFAPQGVPPRDAMATDLRFLPPFVSLSPDALMAAAERILAGRYSLFNLEDCDLGDPPEWNRDPLTRQLAQLRHAGRIDYRDERVVGNIKFLWEANRHLHLTTLAQAHALTGDTRYAFGIRAQIESWIAQCPVGRGPNWVSALELGIRLINWSLSWQLIGGWRSRLFAEAEGVDFRDRWLDAIYQHARMISGNLSRFSSANNHLIGETAGVYVAACTWPLWPSMREWGERCRGILEAECLRQNAPDGGNREQAFGYQTFVMDFLLISGLAARARGEDFSPLYWRRLEAMVDFLASMTDVSGNLPMIGDADDGYVVRLAPEPGFSPHGSLIATGAVLFDRPDLAAKVATADGKTVTLLGIGAVRRLARLNERARREFRPRQQFPESGYYLLGTALESPDEVRLLVNAGPLGYLSLAAHGHADALSVVLSIAGREILVDPGTYAYHTEPAWRRYFRSTRAHNTVCVDGEDQSSQAGNFMWTHHAKTRCLAFSEDADSQHFAGEHDGYARLPDPLLHRRELELIPRLNRIEMIDTLRCEGEHVAERAWHFPEDCEVGLDGAVIRVTTGIATAGVLRVTFEPLEAPQHVEVHRGGDASQGGWISRSFGRKLPATTVRWRSRVDGFTVLRTRIHWTRSRDRAD